MPEICGNSLDDNCNGAADNGCIGDRVWRDNNQDGVQQLGEPGVAGVTLLLRTATGALVAVTVSNTAGTYWFSAVPPGTYYVEVVVPPASLITSVDLGGDDTLDNDFDPEIQATQPFPFSGNVMDHLDCGLFSTTGG